MTATAYTSIGDIHFEYPELKSTFAVFEISLRLNNFEEIRQCQAVVPTLARFFGSDILAPVTFGYKNADRDKVTGLFTASIDFTDKVLELFLILLINNLKPQLHDRFSDQITVRTIKQTFQLQLNINALKNKKRDP
jgi:hypothetical protein